jgi:hypothetical protein
LPRAAISSESIAAVDDRFAGIVAALVEDRSWPFATSQERWGELHDDRTVDYFVLRGH